MKQLYIYNGVEVSKREYELIQFIQTGSNSFQQAYYVYNRRKPRASFDALFYASWFNRTLKKLHEKGLLKEIPFVLRIGNGFAWENPGIKASKANFECITLHDAEMEIKAEINKML